MLDDLKYIHERDAADALGIAERQWQQLTHEFEVFQDQLTAHNIVYAGMGGSALAALLSQTWPAYELPFEVVRGYDIPAYVNENTYFIAASYSGNTEETLEAIGKAEAAGAMIAVIASGGRLADIAREKNYPLALLPKAEQPRYAVLYNLRALLVLLSQAGLCPPEMLAELESAADFLKASAQPFIATVPIDQNPAKQLALDCIGKSVIVYGGPLLWPVAYKWKISFNENAKHVAWWGQYPEFNHNEFLGWSEQPVDKPYTVIDLRSDLEHARVQKRFELSDALLSGRRPAANIVAVQGSTVLEQLLWGVMYGDFVSLYTAIANGLNPAPVDLIERFKKDLLS